MHDIERITTIGGLPRRSTERRPNPKSGRRALEAAAAPPGQPQPYPTAPSPEAATTIDVRI